MYLRRPEPELVSMVVAQMASAPFTYGPVGGTRGVLPVGWHHDVVEDRIGDGEVAWERSVAALRRWSQFDLSWVEPHDITVPLVPGATFAFVSRQLGLWSVNVCRVVYTIDDVVDGVQRFGFAYGTVGSHVVKGEERFLVERRPDGQVRFSITKFSLPAHPVVQLAGPIARRIQRRFSLDALARMTREATP
jgi:uncharacterized protein (UPF0548 family)